VHIRTADPLVKLLRNFSPKLSEFVCCLTACWVGGRLTKSATWNYLGKDPVIVDGFPDDALIGQLHKLFADRALPGTSLMNLFQA